MDMIKQTLAAFIGSIALAGCLTDPTLVNVPQPVSTDLPADGSDGDGEPLTQALPHASDRMSPDVWAIPPGHLTMAALAPVAPLPPRVVLTPRPSGWPDDPAKQHGFSRRILSMAVGWSA